MLPTAVEEPCTAGRNSPSPANMPPTYSPQRLLRYTAITCSSSSSEGSGRGDVATGISNMSKPRAFLSSRNDCVRSVKATRGSSGTSSSAMLVTRCSDRSGSESPYLSLNQHTSSKSLHISPRALPPASPRLICLISVTAIVDRHLFDVKVPLAVDQGAQNNNETGDADKDIETRKRRAMLVNACIGPDRLTIRIWLRLFRTLKKQHRRAQKYRNVLIKEQAELAMRDAADLKEEMVRTRLMVTSRRLRQATWEYAKRRAYTMARSR
ncbi:hypothetical protein PG985_002782 [Apiospora marii]|uniref:Uncharacterized protein n=1 Tax=Apiospora marii TaxID=335849 RepID=A0ABR1RTQ4_9PEZI